MKRYFIINSLVKKFHYKNYLEIGVQQGASFNAVQCANKTGVDPDPKAGATYVMTSDEFFKKEKSQMFDIVFIDGSHRSDQALMDIFNSLNRLNPGGAIVMHDCLPENEDMQKIPRITKKWTGNVWKAFVRFRTINPSLAFTVDTDHGCGVIIPSMKGDMLEDREDLSWNNFVQNKKRWMNIKTSAEFERWISSL